LRYRARVYDAIVVGARCAGAVGDGTFSPSGFFAPQNIERILSLAPAAH
jgi:hypothetical protein